MAMAQQRSHLIELWAVILTTDESKIQACIHLDHSLCLDGAIPGVCYLLLATVSPKSGAIVVYQHHVSLVHRKLTWCWRSEEHTSELQSRFDLVCRLLLEKK